MGLDVLINRFSNGKREWNRHCISDLNILRPDFITRKSERVGEPLQSSRFSYGNSSVLDWMNVGSPMRVAFGQNSRSKAIFMKSAVSLCMVCQFRAAHACW